MPWPPKMRSHLRASLPSDHSTSWRRGWTSRIVMLWWHFTTMMSYCDVRCKLQRIFHALCRVPSVLGSGARPCNCWTLGRQDGAWWDSYGFLPKGLKQEHIAGDTEAGIAGIEQYWNTAMKNDTKMIAVLQAWLCWPGLHGQYPHELEALDTRRVFPEYVANPTPFRPRK